MAADVLTPEQRKKNMSAIRAKDTKPEIKLRRLLHKAGFRYRLYQNTLPGKPDLVLKKYNAVIFVNSCFWHCHSNCKYFKGYPKTNTEFWEKKLSQNVKRDLECYIALKKLGYRICIVWECAIKGQGKYSESSLIQQIDNWLKSKQVEHCIAGLTNEPTEN